jgi:hypothetical protein
MPPNVFVRRPKPDATQTVIASSSDGERSTIKLSLASAKAAVRSLKSWPVAIGTLSRSDAALPLAASLALCLAGQRQGLIVGRRDEAQASNPGFFNSLLGLDGVLLFPLINWAG